MTQLLLAQIILWAAIVAGAATVLAFFVTVLGVRGTLVVLALCLAYGSAVWAATVIQAAEAAR